MMNRKDYIEWIIGQIRVSKGQNSESVVLADDDWQNIYNISLEEGVAPYLYYCINKSGSELIIPEPIKNKFIKTSQNVLARNTILYHELSKVLRSFSEMNIPVIVLKGAYLSEKVYPHNGLRPMGDIDLLVKQNSLLKVQKILLKNGFLQSEQLSIQEQCDKSHHLLPFTNLSGTTIEVHWNIYPPHIQPFKIDVSCLWKRSIQAMITNENILALSCEDLLLHLCFHTSCHHLYIFGLKSFCDIAEVIRKYGDEINWDQVQQYTELWKAEKGVYITLYFVKELFGVALPDKVLVKLKSESFNQQLIAMIEKILYREREMAPKLDQNLVNVLGKKGSGIERALNIINTVFPAKSIIASKYNITRNSSAVYIFYFVRLLNLVFRYSRSVFRLLRFETTIHTSFEQANQREMLRNWMKSSDD